MGTFHEDMTLVQRDRSAAYFAEDDGAQILLCSEIGSEGRNFQFAHRLVLLDLPLDPALLEQRIGRLDRIGQTETIQIIVPYLLKTSEENDRPLVHHEGLDAFETCQQSGHRYVKRFGETLSQLMERLDKSNRFEKKKFETLVKETSAFHKETVSELEAGRDRLLELNSFRSQPATQLVREITEADESPGLERFFLQLLDHFGVTVEELQPRVYHLKPEHVYTDAFPNLPEEGISVTLDRSIALKREESNFSPGSSHGPECHRSPARSEQGNCASPTWTPPGPRCLFLECVYVLECVAPTYLQADRFFPATPIRVLVNHRNEDYSNTISAEQIEEYIRPGKPQWVQKNVHILQDLLPKLQEFSEAVAQEQVPDIISGNRVVMRTKLRMEADRLRHLRSINHHVREEEIEMADHCLKELESVMAAARLRLDSMRLLYKGDD